MGLDFGPGESVLVRIAPVMGNSMSGSARKKNIPAAGEAHDTARVNVPAGNVVNIALPQDARAASPGEKTGGSHVLGEVRRIASDWYGIAAGDIFQFHTSGITGMPTPEALYASCGEAGLDVRYEERSLGSLKAFELPFVLLLKDGSGYLVSALVNNSQIEVDIAGQKKLLEIKTLKKEYTGVLLFVRPRRFQTSGSLDEDIDAVPGADDNAEPVSVIKTVVDYTLKHNKALLWQLALAAGLSNMFLVLLPLFIMAVYDRVIPHLAMETLWALAMGVGIALLLDLAVRVVRLKLLDAISLSTSNALQTRLYSRLVRLQLCHAPRTAGGLASAVNELDGMCHTVPQLFVALLVDLPFFILLLVLLYFIGNAVVIGPIIGVSIIAAANMLGYFGSRHASSSIARLAHKKANMLIEAIGSIEVVKSTTSENSLLRKWERLIDSSSFSTHTGRMYNGFSGQFTIIISQATIVFTLILGVYQLREGNITVGALAAATLLVGRAISPVGNLINLLVRAFHFRHSSQSIQRINDAPVEKAGDNTSIPMKSFKGRIDFRNVDFTYPDEPAPVLKNINLTIEPGEKIGVIGRIGCGKSTLIRLIPRFYEASSGAVLLDGHDIRQYSPQRIRRHVGYMPQDYSLFNDTLRENICFGMDDVCVEDFERAVEIAGVKNFASRNPNGYGMQVGVGGERLSGGERQAVVMARTLLRDPEMLVLDEPTSAMDNTLERQLLEKLWPEIEGRTLILATHRAPLLALVDRIIWLDDGRVIADGPRDEVLKSLDKGK